MPTTTLKPKTTKGGSATKASLTNASAEKSRKMLEQMLAKKLSSSTKMPKTMTIKTGATKKSTASAGATIGRKGGRRGGAGGGPPGPYIFKCTAEAAPSEEAERTGVEEAAATVVAVPEGYEDKTGLEGGYKKKSYTKKSSCGTMSAKRPTSAKPAKKSSCGTMSAKPRPKSAKPKPKSAKK